MTEGERLNGYLDHELSAAERSAFEAELRSNPELLARLESFSRLSDALKPGAMDARIATRVKAAVRLARFQEARRKRLLWGALPTGALALAVALVMLWPQPAPSLTPSDLYSQYSQAVSALGN